MQRFCVREYYFMKIQRLFLLIAILISCCLTNVQAQRIAILGDSNTWLGGDENKGEKGWNHWFVAEFKPDFCKSYARSGATWTSTNKTKLDTKENIGSLGDNNVAYNQLQRLLADKTMNPDIIIIALGTNDLWFKNKRPNLFAEPQLNSDSKSLLSTPPNKLLTLADCVTFTVKTLKKAYPKAKIVFISPAQCVQVDKKEISLFGDKLETLGKELEVATIRLDKLSLIDSDKEKKKKEFTYDGVHTSVKGAKANGTLIANELKKLVLR